MTPWAKERKENEEAKARESVALNVTRRVTSPGILPRKVKEQEKEKAKERAKDTIVTAITAADTPREDMAAGAREVSIR